MRVCAKRGPGPNALRVLDQHRRAPDMSISQLADTLGLTRNQVAGAFRDHLPDWHLNRTMKQAGERPDQAERVRRRHGTRKLGKPKPADRLPVVFPDKGRCVYPHGDILDPAGIRFCGAKAMPLRPYCEAHHAICWRKEPPKPELQVIPPPAMRRRAA